MSTAQRIPAAEKSPEDFLPPHLPAVVKKVCKITVTRKSGAVEETVVILRPGDSAAIDGKKVLEG